MLLALPGSLMILFDWGTGEVGIFLIGMFFIHFVIRFLRWGGIFGKTCG